MPRANRDRNAHILRMLSERRGPRLSISLLREAHERAVFRMGPGPLPQESYELSVVPCLHARAVQTEEDPKAGPGWLRSKWCWCPRCTAWRWTAGAAAPAGPADGAMVAPERLARIRTVEQAVRRADHARRLRVFSVGSNAGGGGGWVLRYATRRDAADALEVLQAAGADARLDRRGLEVTVPRASRVTQLRSGPTDGPSWPGAGTMDRVADAR